MRDNELFSPFDYDFSCWRMACDPIVYTRTAIDFGPVSQCCQLVIVMPTPPCSHARYALCPALYPPALYNRYSTGGVCTAGIAIFRLYPIKRVRVAFLRRALAPYLRQVAFARRFRRSPFGPVAVGRFIT